MTILRTQLIRQRPPTPQTNRPPLHINQHRRTRQRPHAGGFDAPIRNNQTPPQLLRMRLGPLRQPLPSLRQRRHQRRPATGPQLLQPRLQSLRGFQPMPLPARLITTGRQQRQPRPPPIRLVKQLSQQPLGIRQRLMPPGRSRSIDNHQPQLMGTGASQLPTQILQMTRPPLQQGRGPIHRAPTTGTRSASTPLLLPGLGFGTRAGAMADAQGFFGQLGTSRRCPMGAAWGGKLPHWPSALEGSEAREGCSAAAGGCGASGASGP